MKYNIGQTHQVDLGSPVTYAGNTIYKGGTVVSLNGSLYVAKYNIPPTDEGPLKSDRWELINATTPYGYVNAVTDLGWDNTGNIRISEVPNNINIFLPRGYYRFKDVDINNVNLLGEYSAYSPLGGGYNGTKVIGTFNSPTTSAIIHIQNIYFDYSITNLNRTVFEDCHLKSSTSSETLTVYFHCSFARSVGNELFENNTTTLLYDCAVLRGSDLTGENPLGRENVIWYNPLLNDMTSEHVGSATLYNPTFH